MKLKLAIVATIFTAIAFLFLFFYIGINIRRNTYKDSKLLAKEISRKAAIETETYLNSALVSARVLEQKAKIFRRLGSNRKEITQILQEALDQNPDYLAAWTLWEPNAYDGKDKYYIGDSLCDENGTLGIGFFKYKNRIIHEVSTSNDFSENYYAIPRSLESEVILEPYNYVYHQHDINFYETSVIVPVIENGKFLGAFGIDLNLRSLQEKLNNVKLFKSGCLSLISNEGIIVSHPDSSIISKNIRELSSSFDSLALSSIKDGKELIRETVSEFSNERVFRFYYPINISNLKTPWSMMVEIPIEEATIRSKQMLYVAIATLVIGLSLIIYLIFNIIDRRHYEKTITEALDEVKKSNEIVSESERNYRQIYNSTNEAIFIHDARTGEILDVNDIMISMYGFGNKKEVLLCSVSDLSSNIPPYTVNEAKNYLEKTLNEGSQVFEWQSKKKNGDFFWTEVSLRKGSFSGNDRILAVVRDITERKLATKAIKESEEKYRTLLDNMDEVVMVLDNDSRIQYVNRMFTLKVGYKPEEMIGEIGFNLLTDSNDINVINNAAQNRITNKNYQYELTFKSKDGKNINFLANGAPLKNADEVEVGSIVTLVDITERKKNENALKESEQRYRTLLEAFPDIIMVSDLNGDIIYGNEALEKITGITKEDYNNPNRKAKIHPDDLPVVSDAINELIKSKETQTKVIDNRFIDMWGKTHWFRGIIAKIRLNDKQVLQTITRDITQRKANEKELEKYRNHLEFLVKERTDELEAANEELSSYVEELNTQREELEATLDNLQKTQNQLIQSEKMASLGILAAGVAHEINNPLNFISAGIGGLENYISYNFNEHLEAVAPIIDGIKEGVRRSAVIVESLNHYSSSDDLSFTACNLHSIIDNCLIMLNNQLKHRVTVDKQYSDKEFTVYGNEGKLHQAILNILTNAIHAIEDKGNIELSTILNNSNVVLSIRDNGHGIDSDLLPKIMDPFFTTKEPGRGTGLGLSITYKIIKEHNGYLEFQSQIGKGTLALITLPIQN